MAVVNEQMENGNQYSDRLYAMLTNQTGVATLKTINVDHGAAGQFLMMCIGVDENGKSVRNTKIVDFEKDATTGNLTLSSQDVLTIKRSTGMTGTQVSVVNVGNHIAIQVTNPSPAKPIMWQVTINPANIVALNYY